MVPVPVITRAIASSSRPAGDGVGRPMYSSELVSERYIGECGYSLGFLSCAVKGIDLLSERLRIFSNPHIGRFMGPYISHLGKCDILGENFQ